MRQSIGLRFLGAEKSAMMIGNVSLCRGTKVVFVQCDLHLRQKHHEHVDTMRSEGMGEQLNKVEGGLVHTYPLYLSVYVM